MMEDAMGGEVHPSIARKPKVGNLDGLKELIEEGCRLDVEA